MATIGTLVIDLVASTAQLQRGMNQATGMLKGFEGNVRTMSRSITGLLGFAGVTLSIRGIVNAGKEAEAASNKLRAVLHATGNAAGFTKSQIDEMAESMARSTLFDDEAIRNAAAVMLTFQNVQGETFKKGIALAGDLSTVFGSDLQTAIVQVGKALNSPKEGISALSRVGVQFSAAQKKQIEQMLKMNDLAGAQKLILDRLASSVGGAAGAANSGLTGAVSGLTKAWNEMLEAMAQSPKAGGLLAKGSQWVADRLNNIRRGFAPPTADDLRAEAMNLRAVSGRGNAAMRQHFTESAKHSNVDLPFDLIGPDSAKRFNEYANVLDVLATRMERLGKAGSTVQPVILAFRDMDEVLKEIGKRVDVLQAFQELGKGGDVFLNMKATEGELINLLRQNNLSLEQRVGLMRNLAAIQAAMRGTTFTPNAALWGGMPQMAGSPVPSLRGATPGMDALNTSRFNDIKIKTSGEMFRARAEAVEEAAQGFNNASGVAIAAFGAMAAAAISGSGQMSSAVIMAMTQIAQAVIQMKATALGSMAGPLGAIVGAVGGILIAATSRSTPVHVASVSPEAASQMNGPRETKPQYVTLIFKDPSTGKVFEQFTVDANRATRRDAIDRVPAASLPW